MKKFEEKVWELLKKIPKGKITTYKQIAIALGKPNAARAVGNACNRNPNAPKRPCHRVVKSSGEVGGYAKGVNEKIKLLLKEGINIKKREVINLGKVLIEARNLR